MTSLFACRPSLYRKRRALEARASARIRARSSASCTSNKPKEMRSAPSTLPSRTKESAVDGTEKSACCSSDSGADGTDERYSEPPASVLAALAHWEAWLRWALAHLARDVGLANGGGADAGGHRKHWTQALEQCVAQLLPADPRAAELVRRVRGAGHHAVAQQVETVLRDQGKLI